jgi:hypothetical protein
MNNKDNITCYLQAAAPPSTIGRSLSSLYTAAGMHGWDHQLLVCYGLGLVTCDMTLTHVTCDMLFIKDFGSMCGAV